MNTRSRLFQSNLTDFIKTIALATGLTALSFWLQAHIGICLEDEGFLWYGCEHTALGEVPLRDFQSYDPGRYYWSTAWSPLLGDGILALRASTAIFQILGLTCGLLVIRRLVHSWWGMGLAGCLLLIWMIPQYKIYEHAVSMAFVYFFVRLIENPTLRSHFIAGISIGLAAILSRNHGVYGAVSCGLLILAIWYRTGRTGFVSRFGSWTSGVVAGYSPMLLMFLLVPGFFESYLEGFRLLFRIKATNISLSIPWPWTFAIDDGNMSGTIRLMSPGVFFLLLPLFYASAGVLLAVLRSVDPVRKAPLIASVFVGSVYMHYCFSRADLTHLACGIPPFLLGVFSLPFMSGSTILRRGSIACLVMVLGLSLLAAGTASPFCIASSLPGEEFQTVDLNGDRLLLMNDNARLIQSAIWIDTHVVPRKEPMLIAPHTPGLYSILKRKSPLWDIYLLFPEIESRQRSIIAELRTKKVNWVILGDIFLDGRDDLRFRSTHPLVWKHFCESFEKVPVPSLPDNYQLLRRK